MENWLGSSLNQIQGWTAFRESYSRALEQGSLFCTVLTYLELPYLERPPTE